VQHERSLQASNPVSAARVPWPLGQVAAVPL